MILLFDPFGVYVRIIVVNICARVLAASSSLITLILSISTPVSSALAPITICLFLGIHVSRLLEELVLVCEVGYFHLLFELLLNLFVDPRLGALPFVGLINHILMLVFDVFQDEFHAFELLRANLALILFARLNFFGFICTEIFNILSLKVINDLVWIIRWRSRSLFNAIDSRTNILLQKCEAS